MNPGVSHRNRTGRSNASHSCRNRAALSAASTSIAPPRWVVSLATTPSGRPSTLASAVTIPAAHPRRSSSTDPVSNIVVDHGTHVVHARSVLGHEVAQRALVGARPLGDVAAEVREVLLRHRHRSDVVVDGDVDHPVGDLRLERRDLGRLVHAETAAFDHRRTAHRDVRTRDADDDVAAPEDGRVAGEAVPRRDPDERHQPAQSREVVEREAVEARTPRACRCRRGAHPLLR